MTKVKYFMGTWFECKLVIVLHQIMCLVSDGIYFAHCRNFLVAFLMNKFTS